LRFCFVGFLFLLRRRRQLSAWPSNVRASNTRCSGQAWAWRKNRLFCENKRLPGLLVKNPLGWSIFKQAEFQCECVNNNLRLSFEGLVLFFSSSSYSLSWASSNLCIFLFRFLFFWAPSLPFLFQLSGVFLF
jgi:hypothetical protein